MPEGFEPYHVPQQSRRDKLRVGGCVSDNLNQGCVGLLPLYDPSSLDLLNCAALHPHHETQTSYQDMANNPFYYAPQNINPSFNNNITSTQGLSLTLSSSSSHHNSYMYGNNDGDKVTGGYAGVGSTSSDISRNNNHHRQNNNNMLLPLGPFVGYATILKESRFSKPAEQLLQGICDVGCGNYAEKITSDSPLMDPPPLDAFTGTEFVDHQRTSSDDRSKKSRLISMLDEVYRRYKQYYQQVQAVVASFENVPGLSNAAPYAHLALKAMNKHFGYLKNMITDQLQFAAKSPQGQIISYGNEDSSPKGIFGQKQNHNNGNNNNQLLQGFNEHQPPVWRPQRGLPERAVTVLRAWLFEHFLHPYPTDTDKLMLAKQTGLSRNQVSNWFINARVRLWKPMVEEIHTLETRESQKSFQREDQSTNSGRLVSNHFPQSTSLSVMTAENPSTSSSQMVQDISLKRTRNVFLNNPMGIEEPMNLMYNNSLHNQNNNHHHHHQEMGVGTSGVSLTLGLHQNSNGVVFPEPYPMNAARRFGLDSNNDEGYVMGNYEGQNRQIGRNYMGGQLLHDFVG